MTGLQLEAQLVSLRLDTHLHVVILPGAGRSRIVGAPQARTLAMLVPEEGLSPFDGQSAAVQEFFQVGDVSLKFSPDSSVSIDEDFYLNVWGQAVPALGELWSGYESDHKLGFRLRFRGVHRAGVATGEAHFEAGRSESFDQYLWNDGWSCGLEFTGSAVLAGGWLEMRGEMAPCYQVAPRAAVRLAWRLPGLDWSLYRFGSLEETEGADPSWVTRLDLAKREWSRLPARVLEFHDLRSLRVREIPLQELELGDLTRLEELQVYGSALSELPASLGRLQMLSWLSISQSRLQTTPRELWSLSGLRHLDLSGNLLVCLPDQVQLPVLRFLNLAGNRLTTVPAALALQPCLEKIGLQGNPLESLPDAFAELDLDLSLADKMRLLDFRYRGAGGRGVVAWDNSVFAAEAPEPWGELALRALALRPVESIAPLGATRFGGWPDLPVGLEYPRYGEYHYEFIAQLNCADLAGLQGYLPRTGRLYFFLSNIHDLQPLVIYREDSELVAGSTLELTAETFYDTWEVPYPGYAVEVSTSVSLPCGYSAGSNPHLFQGELARRADELEEWREQQSSSSCHEVNCHVFTQHESPQLQAALKYRGHPSDWLVLLKVASLGGFQWGDAGELFYVIHKSDLARADFSAIYCTCESS